METLNLSTLSFDELLSREWLATNQIGGYAASTLPGCNTRKYHGLLVAAMSPPVRRMVLLSRVEETVFDEGWPNALACNEYPETVHPAGQKLLMAFSNEPFPRWAYQHDGWTVEKQLRLLRGENTVLLSYTLLGAAKPVDLEVRPLFAMRGIHELMFQWNGNLIPESAGASLHHIRATHRTPEVFFGHDGEWKPEGHWYLNTIYRREQERGYSGLEDLWSPGVVRFALKPGQTVHFVCSTEPIDLARVIDESKRQYSAVLTPVIVDQKPDANLVALSRAADQHVLQTRDGATLAGGYPWAAPSGRDALINLPGLLLVRGKLSTARCVLDRFAAHVDRGLMPSEFPGEVASPKYKGADVSLWFINAVQQYLRYSADDQSVQKWFGVIDQILTRYEEGTGLGVQCDADGLLHSGTPGIAASWMDAELVDGPITARHGMCVEINALWYNALRIGADLARRFHQPLRAEQWSTLANRTKASFNKRFWNEQTRCCFDVLADRGDDASVRPNQLFAISLLHPVLNIEKHEAVLTRLSDQLLTAWGIRTLSPNDPHYQGRYGGPVVSRDRAYHQGCVYPWLLGPFISAFVRVYGRSPGVREQARRMLEASLAHLHAQGCGQLNELFDGSSPHHAGGLTASARSVAEILRVYVEDVLDLPPVDVIGKSGNARSSDAGVVAGK